MPFVRLKQAFHYSLRCARELKWVCLVVTIIYVMSFSLVLIISSRSIPDWSFSWDFNPYTLALGQSLSLARAMMILRSWVTQPLGYSVDAARLIYGFDRGLWMLSTFTAQDKLGHYIKIDTLIGLAEVHVWSMKPHFVERHILYSHISSHFKSLNSHKRNLGFAYLLQTHNYRKSNAEREYNNHS